MIIQKLTLKNKFICVSDITMEMEENGVYIITGENGCGKTTLLEKIVFGNEEINFSSEEEMQLYKSERYTLFTYCPQKIVVNELSVKEYIYKLNLCVDEEQLQGYFGKFGLDIEILNQRFYTLSGGEQMKVSIISGLLKNTSYVFLDEPTNYLDNASVSALVSIIQEETKKRRFIIVSHDERLRCLNYKEYHFCDGTVKSVETKNTHEIIESETKELNATVRMPRIGKLIRGLTKNIAYIALFVIMFFLLAGVVFITNMGFSTSVDSSGFPQAGSIFAYDVSYHEALNTYYEEAEGLVVDESDYSKGIVLDDLEKILDMKGVSELYVVDEKYMYELDCYLGFVPEVEADSDELFILACPEVIFENYLECSNFYPLLKYSEGELPRDGEKEIAISKNLLIKKYGYNENSVETAIGNILSIDINGTNEEYTIVGHTYYDFAVISFEENLEYGVDKIDRDTLSSFKAKMSKYFDELGMEDRLANVLIIVDEKAERSILNYFFVNHPSCCYYSNYYAEKFVEKQRADAVSKWFVIHLVSAGVMALVVWGVNRNGIKYNMRLIWDIGNYYINRRKIMITYIKGILIEYAILILVLIGANTAISKYAGPINGLVLMDGIIIMIPLMLSCAQAYREANK